MYNIENIFANFKTMPSPRENAEARENARKNESLMDKAQKEFVQENELNLSLLQNQNNIDRFKNFLNRKSGYRELALNIAGFTQDQKDILSEQIKEEAKKVQFVITKNRKDLEKIFSQEFTRNLWLVNHELITTKSSELIKLIKSEEERKKFFERVNTLQSGQAVNYLQKPKDYLSKIKITRKALKKLSQDQLQIINDLLKLDKKVNFSDIEAIITILADDESKQNFLKYFISRVSVDDLERSALSSNIKKDIKKKIIKSIKNELWVPEDEAEKVYSSLDRSQIFINTDELDSINVTDLLNEVNIKREIIEQYNWDLAESWALEDELEGLWLDKKGKIHQNFIDFVKNSSDISPNIKSKIDSLQKWNLIELKNWEKRAYYYIKNVDIWNSKETKTMEFENITWNSWFKKIWKWFEEIYAYKQFFKLLKNISQNNQKLDINLFSPEAFKESWATESIDDSSEINNYDELVLWLDKIDPAWKEFGLSEDKTVIYSEKDNFVFLIDSINKRNKTIIVDQWWLWKKKITFKDLYQVMASNPKDLKRAKKINNLNELVLWLSWADWLSGLTVKWWKLYDKVSDPKLSYPVNSFAWKDNKWALIKSISETSVDYNIWTVEKDSKKKRETLKKASNSKNLTQFLFDIKTDELKPKLNSKLENEKMKPPEKKTDLIKAFMSGLSIYEIINSFEFLINWVKVKLEKWNRLKSIKFAQKFSWLLWAEVWNYLQSKREQEEKSLVEEMKNDLQALDSGFMIEQIIRIVTNKSSAQYEIVACLFSVLKYWNIYPKGLAKYSGTYFWYTALWWTNSFRIEREQAARKAWNNYPEEDLIQDWLKFKWSKAEWSVFRSKLWKDYAKELSAWWASEYEAWKEDTSKKTTVNWRIWDFIWAIEWREYSNALWAMEAVFWFNWSTKDMQSVAFILPVLWYGEGFYQEIVKRVKGIAATTPYISLMFWISKEWGIVYRNFIKALIKNAPDLKANQDKILKDFDAIFKHEKPAKKAYDFWETYWDKLVKYINFSDPLVALKKDEIPEFKAFFEKAQWLWTDNEYAPKKEDIDIWVYEKNNIWIVWWWNMLWYMIWNFNGDFGTPTAEAVFDMYIDTFKNIKNWSWTPEEKKKLFIKTYEPFERKVTAVSWQFIGQLDITKHKMYAKLRSNWLDIVKNQTKPANYEALLGNIYDNFMASSTATVATTTWNTKTSIDDIIRNPNG